MKYRAIAVSTALFALVAILAFAEDAVQPVFTDSKGLAIRGYDPVAYFELSKPVKGSEQFKYQWMGATWRFSSESNRDRFSKDPEKYAPQYGGYCAYGVTEGYAAATDPQAWKIVDGKLYLNYDKEVGRLWSKNIAKNIHKADSLWPQIPKKAIQQ